MSSIVPMTFANLSPQIATLRHLHKRWISRTPPPRAAHPGTPARSPLDLPAAGAGGDGAINPALPQGPGSCCPCCHHPVNGRNVHRRPRQHRSEGGPERHGEHGARWERSPSGSVRVRGSRAPTRSSQRGRAAALGSNASPVGFASRDRLGPVRGARAWGSLRNSNPHLGGDEARERMGRTVTCSYGPPPDEISAPCPCPGGRGSYRGREMGEPCRSITVLDRWIPLHPELSEYLSLRRYYVCLEMHVSLMKTES